MPRLIVAIVVSVLAGLAIGAWLGNGDAPTQQEPGSAPMQMPGEDASVEERIAYLEQVVLQEREARIALEDTLATLFDDLERLETANQQAAAAGSETERERRGTPGALPSFRNYAEWVARNRERRVDRLVEGGFTEVEARRALDLESQVALAALKSSWEAERSGEEVDPLAVDSDPQAMMRRGLGDVAFERYLAAQGQPTAIWVNEVFAGSPGSEAGMQPGDQVVSYAGERVFSMTELRRRTMQGAPGESVIIEVERDGMRIQLSVPRGPIGIMGTGASVGGLNWWGG